MLTNMVHHNHQRISKLESLHGKTFYICNKVFYTSCLDPGSDLTLPQGAIVGGDGNTKITQLWTLLESPNNAGYYYMTSAVYPKSRIATNKDGVRFHNGPKYPDQLWKFEKIGINTYRIINFHRKNEKLVMLPNGVVATSNKKDENDQIWTLLSV